MNKKTALIILDGWGNGKPYRGNAIYLSRTPNFDSLVKSCPGTSLKTSGEDVGLPHGQMGNSEVGHMNIGAGRVVYQQLVLINKAFSEGAVNTNPVLTDAIAYAKREGKKIHLIGLVSDGGVHSSLEHLLALCGLMAENRVDGFYVHAFTDGRDTDPKSGLRYLEQLQNTLGRTGGKLAGITGRYYAMDRDKRWERVKVAYDAMVHASGELSQDPLETLKARYEAGETDEFIRPVICADKENKPLATISEGDVVICFNFRTDRGREITQALSQQDFHEQNIHRMDLRYITLTEYDKTFKDVEVVFPDIDLEMTLGEVLEHHGKKQVRIAETEKYPHVTFFFSGGREKEFNGETRHLCPSPRVPTYDLQPEMSAEDVCLATLGEMERGEADFLCVNFANPDMVGHTGVIEAEIKAVEKVDECLGRIVEAATRNHYTLIVTADHGNGEYMQNEEDGSPNTAHTTNEVPCLLVNSGINNIVPGRLADLAPTILHLMGIPQPEQMTGKSLITG